MGGNFCFDINLEHMIAGRKYKEVTIIISDHVTAETAAGTMNGKTFAGRIIGQHAEVCNI